MGFFPFYINIENKKCIVIGGGKVALRKINKLLQFGCDITVIAPEICDEILALDNVKTELRKFDSYDMQNAFMVIVATDNASLNKAVAQLCKERNIPVNVVDQPEYCTFYFPAIVRKNNITVGISTEGKSPFFARYLRKRIENEIDDNLINTFEILSDYRNYIKNNFDTEEQRKRALNAVFDLCISCGEDTPKDEDIKFLLNNIRYQYEN